MTCVYVRPTYKRAKSVYIDKALCEENPDFPDDGRANLDSAPHCAVGAFKENLDTIQYSETALERNNNVIRSTGRRGRMEKGEGIMSACGEFAFLQRAGVSVLSMPDKRYRAGLMSVKSLVSAVLCRKGGSAIELRCLIR